MKISRFLSFFLAALTVLSAGLFSLSSCAGEQIPWRTVSAADPYILCDVGETVALGEYSVAFGGEYYARENVTFLDAAGNECESITPERAGVTPLTVRDGEEQTTVYLVAKEKGESEYVLYELDFSAGKSIAALKQEGCRFNRSTVQYTLKDGALYMGDVADDYARFLLPEWLSAFGEYAISVDARVVETKNDKSWFGLCLRMQEQGDSHPYYAFCTREDPSQSVGVELIRRESASSSQTLLSTASEPVDLTDGAHNFTAKSYGGDFSFSLDGKQALFATRMYTGTIRPAESHGGISLATRGMKVAVENIRVTLQTEAIRSTSATTSNLIDNLHANLPLRNAIANVTALKDNDATALSAENTGIALFEAKGDLHSMLNSCAQNSVVATVRVNSTGEADRLLEAAASCEYNDLTVVSADESVLRYVRSLRADVRTGLCLDSLAAELSVAEASALRERIRKAPATFCLVPAHGVTRESVQRLQALSVAVWLQIAEPAGSDAYFTAVARALTTGANGIVSDSAQALSSTARLLFASNTMTRTPLIIGHRGDGVRSPENSLSGFQNAYDNGADSIELDVEITADGTVIVLHDATLNRTTNYKGEKTVNDMTLAEVKEYRLMGLDGKLTEESVPTLAEVLELFRGKDCTLLLEFKGAGEGLVAAAARVIREADMVGRVNVISFNEEFIAEVRTELPGMSVGKLASFKGTALSTATALNILAPAIDTAQAGEGTINMANGAYSSLLQQAAVDRGLTVWPYTYESTRNNLGFLSGCDGLTTDDVRWARDMQKQIFAKHDRVELAAGQTADIAVFSETYGNETVRIDEEDLLVVITEGEGLLSVEGGTVRAREGVSGEATLLFGHRTKTVNGSEYVLYTEPVTVSITK